MMMIQNGVKLISDWISTWEMCGCVCVRERERWWERWWRCSCNHMFFSCDSFLYTKQGSIPLRLIFYKRAMTGALWRWQVLHYIDNFARHRIDVSWYYLVEKCRHSMQIYLPSKRISSDNYSIWIEKRLPFLSCLSVGSKSAVCCLIL